MKIGNKEFDLKNHAYVMGILNVTPDSFSDGGKWNDKGRAMRHTQEMIEQGATIIDIGGESTRPGYTLISDEEEISRVVPMIEMVKKNFDVPVSIDTYKSRVAEAALDAGADLVNDIWGLKYDLDLAGVIARKNAPCCLMHNRKEPDYTDFIVDFLKDMQETIDIAKKAGIADENIILDPGVGFGKTYENNLESSPNWNACIRSAIRSCLELPENRDRTDTGSSGRSENGRNRGNHSDRCDERGRFCPCTRCKRKLPCLEDDRSHPRQITGR